MTNTITAAFAGSGNVTQANVRALLNDYFGFGPEGDDGWPAPSEMEIRLVFPASDTHCTAALTEVFAWSEYADLPYKLVVDKAQLGDFPRMIADADSVEEALNVNESLISNLAATKPDSVLILAWGDEGDENSHALLDLADQKGVKVLDLTSGLDELSFTDDEPGEALGVPDDEPDPVKPEIVAELPLTEDEVPLEDIADDPEPDPDPVDDDVPSSNDVMSARKARALREKLDAEVEANLNKGEEELKEIVWDSVLDRLDAIEARLAALEAPKKRGRPRKETTE